MLTSEECSQRYHPTKILVKKVKKMKDRPFPATNTMKEDVVMSDTADGSDERRRDNRRHDVVTCEEGLTPHQQDLLSLSIQKDKYSNCKYGKKISKRYSFVLH